MPDRLAVIACSHETFATASLPEDGASASLYVDNIIVEGTAAPEVGDMLVLLSTAFSGGGS